MRNLVTLLLITYCFTGKEIIAQNETFAVGSFEGEFKVSNTGAATYTMPINLPEGIAGLTPSLSLAYNSQTGDGLLGLGWRICGLSSITRFPRTIYHDGYSEGITFNDTHSQLAMDGNRLINISGTNEYRTSDETFSEITRIGVYPTNWFEVQTKEGNILKYNKPLSLDSNKDSNILSWRIGEIKDGNNNRIIFDYYDYDGEDAIKTISYSNYTVEFGYIDRDDINSGYIASQKFKREKLLSEILIKFGNTIISRYSIDYDFFSDLNGVKESRIKSVSKYGQDGLRYPPTEFIWSEGVNGSNITFDNAPYQEKRYFCSDFNGDGLQDYVILTSNNSLKKWQLSLGQPSGQFHNIDWVPIQSNNFESLHITDLNNDGKADLLMEEKHNVDMPNGTYTAKFLCFSFNVLENKLKRAPSFDFQVNNINISDGLLFFGGLDFNGDGLTDYMIINARTKNFIHSNLQSIGNPNFGNPEEVRFLDFNGDGKTDVLVKKGSDYKIFFDGFKNDFSFQKQGSVFLTGDFNGDGNEDIAFCGSNIIKVFPSTGDGLATEQIYYHNLNLSNNHFFFSANINGDSKSDFIAFDMSLTGAPNFKKHEIFLNGDGTHIVKSHNPSTLPYNKNEYIISDFNGDGIADIFFAKYQGSGVINISKYPEKKTITTIEDKIDFSTTRKKLEIEYRSLTDSDGHYDNNVALQTPLRNISLPLFLVIKINTKFHVIEEYEEQYFYKTGYYHTQGLGLIGFAEYETRKINLNEKIRTNVNYDPTTFKPSRITQKNVINEVEIKTLTQSFLHRQLFPKIRFTYLDNKTETNHLTGLSRFTFYEYDDYGNLELIDQEDDFVRKTIVNQYENYNSWCLNKVVKSITNTSRFSPSSTITNVEDFGYWPTGKLKFVTSNGKTTNFSYNESGQILNKEIVGNETNYKFNTNYKYFPNGNLEKITNNENLETTYKYYPSSNLVNEISFPNGTTIKYSYDGFGRIIEKKSPTNITTYITRQYSDETKGTITKTTETTAGNGEISSWYDSMWRLRKITKNGYSGIILEFFDYNNRNQLTKVEYPHYLKENPRSVSYFYDEYGRLDYTENVGVLKDYSYSNNTITTECQGVSTQRTFDLDGNIIELNHNGQSVNYEYNALSKPEKIIPDWGAEISLEYDIYGLQNKLIDPASGTTNYSFNSLGGMISETNAVGSTIGITYYPNGNIKNHSIPPDIITRDYYNSGNEIGRLKQVSYNPGPSPGLPGQQVTYSYDSFGRLKSKNIVSEDFENGSGPTYSYDYNVSNNLANQSFAGINISYEYNNNGFIERIKNGETVLWETLEVNSTGKFIKYKLGNRIDVSKEMNELDQIVEIKAENGNTIIQNFTYAYDPISGNLNSRRDKKRENLEESFVYDQFSRLTSTLVNSQPEITFSYDNKHNMVSKTGVGNFHYQSSSNPYATTKIVGRIGTRSTPQTITYTSFGQPKVIVDGTNKAIFEYGIDLKRRKMTIFENNVIKEIWQYFENFEIKTGSNGIVTKYHYVVSPDGPIAVYIKEGTNSTELFYILKDHLGSITALVRTNGTIAEEYNYDAWGTYRNPDNWTYKLPTNTRFMLNRGFTFHEHLRGFGGTANGLVNMHGRIYDPDLSRFITPDTHIQNPSLPQNFNRYSYCLNNPLKYTDPNGDFYMFAAIPVFMVGSALENMLNMNYYGHRTLGDALISGAKMGFNAFNEATNIYNIPILHRDNTDISLGIGISGLTINLQQKIGLNTYYGGVGIGTLGSPFSYAGYTFNLEESSFGFGVGAGKNYFGWNARFTQNQIGVGYGQTYYGNAVGPDGIPNSQTVGAISFYWKGGSFRIENDKFAPGGQDRWRSNALQLTIGKFVIGSTIYTNDPINGNDNVTFENSPIWKSNRLDDGFAWEDGRVYSAPLYIGFINGSFVERIGYSAREIQDFQQNGVHKWISPWYYFLNYDYMQEGMYYHSGYNNPYSLW